MGFSLFSSFRDPDQFRDRPPPTLFRIFWKLSVRPKIFSGYFENFPSAPNLFRIFLNKFLEIISLFLFNMNFLSNSAKPTFIYLSLSVGINLVLLLSSDPLTVIVGFACLVLSLSSLASFYLDQVMLDQEYI